jgi:RNA recognition motif-containing protein
MTPEQLHNKVFVGGIPPHVDRDGLKEIFSEFGVRQSKKCLCLCLLHTLIHYLSDLTHKVIIMESFDLDMISFDLISFDLI